VRKSNLLIDFNSKINKEDAKAEIDNLFTKNKSKWENEIDQAFERLKKVY
jgi:hypothetical protein